MDPLITLETGAPGAYGRILDWVRPAPPPPPRRHYYNTGSIASWGTLMSIMMIMLIFVLFLVAVSLSKNSAPPQPQWQAQN